MTVEHTKVIDSVAFAKDGKEVILPIVDHLPWDQFEGEHLLLLQEKMNTYLAFIESGQLDRQFPHLKGREVVIKLFSKYPLSDQAKTFYRLASGAISGAGFRLEFELVPPH